MIWSRAPSAGPTAPPSPSDIERDRMARIATSFSVLGHVGSRGSIATHVTAAYANTLVSRLALAPGLHQVAYDLVAQGRDANFDLDDTLRRFLEDTPGRTALHVDVVADQVNGVLAADGATPAALAVLRDIVSGLELESDILERLLERSRPRSGRASSSAPPPASEVLEALEQLGLHAGDSEAHARRVYRRLLSEHHPDKVASRGGSARAVRDASARTHEIISAWETLRSARGWR